MRADGARLHTFVPVVIETFTFLDRNANSITVGNVHQSTATVECWQGD